MRGNGRCAHIRGVGAFAIRRIKTLDPGDCVDMIEVIRCHESLHDIYDFKKTKTGGSINQCAGVRGTVLQNATLQYPIYAPIISDSQLYLNKTLLVQEFLARCPMCTPVSIQSKGRCLRATYTTKLGWPDDLALCDPEPSVNSKLSCEKDRSLVQEKSSEETTTEKTSEGTEKV